MGEGIVVLLDCVRLCCLNVYVCTCFMIIIIVTLCFTVALLLSPAVRQLSFRTSRCAFVYLIGIKTFLLEMMEAEGE